MMARTILEAKQTAARMAREYAGECILRCRPLCPEFATKSGPYDAIYEAARLRFNEDILEEIETRHGISLLRAMEEREAWEWAYDNAPMLGWPPRIIVLVGRCERVELRRSEPFVYSFDQP
jgi:hypothetical protein